eukprot:CAMPEP_0181197082 /NCGR_PEP_ID=MMETSP1096-20121128/15836_1 /TAXON_ID=156174 ORGANISM="Chrysochromulina ericina, Strain CCMP281" /NCGR_SAMPLE_ID=MMETSP1096 /ASSEMBLY_ACC=CAM_ASM_000453 /LENGTH=260 /DNA_ID=CAMNT_0023286939 /DNA_START=356 /DNA_END=1139 /DNA_ORIENTATION=-
MGGCGMFACIAPSPCTCRSNNQGPSPRAHPRVRAQSEREACRGTEWRHHGAAVRRAAVRRAATLRWRRDGAKGSGRKGFGAAAASEGGGGVGEHGRRGVRAAANVAGGRQRGEGGHPGMGSSWRVEGSRGVRASRVLSGGGGRRKLAGGAGWWWSLLGKWRGRCGAQSGQEEEWAMERGEEEWVGDGTGRGGGVGDGTGREGVGEWGEEEEEEEEEEEAAEEEEWRIREVNGGWGRRRMTGCGSVVGEAAPWLGGRRLRQ